MTKTLGISARAKGFPLRLSRQHYFVVHQTYPWLREKGLTDKATDEALSQLPDWPIDQDALNDAVEHGHTRALDYHSGFYKSKTVRVRAEHIKGMVKLLKVTAAFQTSGQLAGTLRRRAESLESVSMLDLLADASR